MCAVLNRHLCFIGVGYLQYLLVISSEHPLPPCSSDALGPLSLALRIPAPRTAQLCRALFGGLKVAHRCHLPHRTLPTAKCLRLPRPAPPPSLYFTNVPSLIFTSLVFCFYVDVKSNTKSESGLRWVEVDFNPLQPTLIHFVVSIFVFILMSSQIQKSESGLRWVEVPYVPLV